MNASGADADRRWGGGDAVALAALIGPSLAVMAPLAIAPLYLAAAVGGVAVMRRREGRWPDLPRAPLWILAAVLVLAGASHLWTVGIAETARLWPRSIAYLGGALALAALGAGASAAARRRIETTLLCGLAMGGSLLAIEVASDAAILHALTRAIAGKTSTIIPEFHNRAISLIALLLAPAVLALARRRGRMAGTALFLAVAAALAQLTGAKSVFALAVGAAVALAAWPFPRHAAAILAAALAVSVLVAPLAAPTIAALPGAERRAALPPQIGHRLVVWEFVSARIAERPLLGWGLNASRIVPGGGEQIVPGTELLPLHPHSAPLQMWLELGVGGAAALAALLAAAALAVGRGGRDDWERAVRLGGVATAATMLFVGYGVWQAWWIGALALAAAVLAALDR